MSAVDVLAVMDAFVAVPGQVCCGFPQGGGMDENGNGEPPCCCGQPFTTDDLREARAAVAELIEAQRGCRDMLRMAAMQFRLSGDDGHARHCDALADKADAALARVTGAQS